MKQCKQCKSNWPNEATFLKHLSHCVDYRQAGGTITERPTEVKENLDLLINRYLVEAQWSISGALRSYHFDTPSEVLRQIDRAEGFISEIKRIISKP